MFQTLQLLIHCLFPLSFIRRLQCLFNICAVNFCLFPFQIGVAIWFRFFFRRLSTSSLFIRELFSRPMHFFQSRLLATTSKTCWALCCAKSFSILTSLKGLFLLLSNFHELKTSVSKVLLPICLRVESAVTSNSTSFVATRLVCEIYHIWWRPFSSSKMITGRGPLKSFHVRLSIARRTCAGHTKMLSFLILAIRLNNISFGLIQSMARAGVILVK